MRRRITIDSTRLSVAVTPFARSVKSELVFRQRSRRNPHLSVLSRPAKWGPQLRGLIERYTDGIKRLCVTTTTGFGRKKEDECGTK